MDCDCLSIDPDKRGRHSNRPRKLTEDARRQVTELSVPIRQTTRTTEGRERKNNFLIPPQLC